MIIFAYTNTCFIMIIKGNYVHNVAQSEGDVYFAFSFICVITVNSIQQCFDINQLAFWVGPDNAL